MQKRLPHRPYTDRQMFARLWQSYLRPYRWMIALAGLLMVIGGSTLGFLSWMLKPTFDFVFVQGREDAIWWAALGIFTLFLVRGTTGVLQRLVMTRVSTRVSAAMQVDLLTHVLSLDQTFHQTTSPGTMISRVSSDAAATNNVWSAILLGAGRDAVSLIALFAVALSVDPLWTLTASIGTPLLIVPVLVLQRYIRRKSAVLREISAERMTRLDEIFHGMVSIKLNGLERYQRDRFRRVTKRHIDLRVKSSVGSALVPGLIDVAVGLGFMMVLLYGGREIISGEKTVGDFMSFFAAMTLAFQPLRRLGTLAGTWQTAAASLERVFELMDMRPSMPSPAAKPARMELADTTIRFENVYLSYGDTPALRGLSFTARSGRMTALVGPSGSGKSTVFGAMTRLVEPTSGRITIGGQDIRDVEVGSLRALFAMVSQDALLFDETIRENILLGRDDVPEERLQAAVKAAHVADFADQLPLGLSTRAGPRGSSLSGGQRQRVAIARALLRDAPILLLDEATSALDSAVEAKVQQAIAAAAEGRTVVVVAHRLSTVIEADHIVVIDQGRVIEEGRHAELAATGGLYAKLYALQSSQ